MSPSRMKKSVVDQVKYESAAPRATAPANSLEDVVNEIFATKISRLSYNEMVLLSKHMDVSSHLKKYPNFVKCLYDDQFTDTYGHLLNPHHLERIADPAILYSLPKHNLAKVVGTSGFLSLLKNYKNKRALDASLRTKNLLSIIGRVYDQPIDNESKDLLDSFLDEFSTDPSSLLLIAEAGESLRERSEKFAGCVSKELKTIQIPRFLRMFPAHANTIRYGGISAKFLFENCGSAITPIHDSYFFITEDKIKEELDQFSGVKSSPYLDVGVESKTEVFFMKSPASIAIPKGYSGTVRVYFRVNAVELSFGNSSINRIAIKGLKIKNPPKMVEIPMSFTDNIDEIFFLLRGYLSL